MVYAAEAHIQYSISNIKSKVSYRMALEWWWVSDADFLQNTLTKQFTTLAKPL